MVHEPQGVDFYVDPRPLTAEERSRISEYIKKDKEVRSEHPTKANGSLESKQATTARMKHKTDNQPSCG